MFVLSLFLSGHILLFQSLIYLFIMFQEDEIVVLCLQLQELKADLGRGGVGDGDGGVEVGGEETTLDPSVRRSSRLL